MSRLTFCFAGSLLITSIAVGCGSGPDVMTDSGSGGAMGGGAVSAGGLGAGGTNHLGGTPGSGGAATSSGGTEASGGNGPASGGASPGGGATGGGANPSGGTSSSESPTAIQAAALMGRGVNLGQMFESTQHPRTLEAARAKIDAYYARGYRNLRIPITWTEAIGGDLLADDATGVVHRDNARLLVIVSVVDYALSLPDLFVVINAHHEDTLKTESRSAVLEQLWTDIADIFKSRGHRLMFEVLNEPHTADGSAMPREDLRTMVGLAYARIREVDAQRIVLIGGNQWFGASEVPSVWTDLVPVGNGDDPYVMAEFHHYDPWTFCGSEQGSYDDVWTQTNQSGPMEIMESWAQTVGKGMPVYIGEWGVGWQSRYSTLTCNNVRAWYTTFDSVHAKGHNQPTALWDDGGWFMVFDHATRAFNNNLIDCIEGECTWDGTEQINDGCL